jgi:hypothetical protein
MLRQRGGGAAANSYHSRRARRHPARRDRGRPDRRFMQNGSRSAASGRYPSGGFTMSIPARSGPGTADDLATRTGGANFLALLLPRNA